MGRVKELLLDDDYDVVPLNDHPLSVEQHPLDRTFYSVFYFDKEIGFVQWSKQLQLWRAVSAVTHKVFHEDGQNQAINRVIEEMA